MIGTPVIRYSPARYRFFTATTAVLGVSLCAYGVARGETKTGLAGIAILMFLALLLRGVIDRLRIGGVALAREGEVLVGGELRRALPAKGTEFEIVPNWEGGWVLVLRHGDVHVRLRGDRGGWKIDGQRRVTKEVLEQVLLEMGLTRGSSHTQSSSPP